MNSDALMRKSRFSIDGMGEGIEGWTDGHLWNGWDDIVVTAAQVKAAAEYLGGTFDEVTRVISWPADFDFEPLYPVTSLALGEDVWSFNGFCFVEVGQ